LSIEDRRYSQIADKSLAAVMANSLISIKLACFCHTFFNFVERTIIALQQLQTDRIELEQQQQAEKCKSIAWDVEEEEIGKDRSHLLVEYFSSHEWIFQKKDFRSIPDRFICVKCGTSVAMIIFPPDILNSKNKK
jgi:hypothetical protein